VRLLSQKEGLPPHVAENLLYAIAICNKAIHGLDVSVREAEDALLHAAAALRAIEGEPGWAGP
jgi:hypothetical protein